MDKEIAELRERNGPMKAAYTEKKRVKTRREREEINLKGNDQREIKTKSRENMDQENRQYIREFSYCRKLAV